MSRISVTLRPTAQLTTTEREELRAVFRESFDARDAEADLQPYFDRVRGVLLARSGGRLIGFQFYQEVEVDGRRVHHFSLAGKARGAKRGVQARLGRGVMLRTALRTPLWRPLYIVGVTNDVRSYATLHRLGRCYPDVLDIARSNPFGGWYTAVAARIGLPAPDAHGLLRDRMARLGFSLRPVDVITPLGRAYLDLVGQDLRHGVFVMVEARLWRDVPRHLADRLRRMLLQPETAL